MKVIIGVGALLAVATPTFIGGQYVSDLRHEMDAAKKEVEFLKGQITQLQGALGNQSGATAMRGPKGDKGDKGEPGLQGPRGEAGPPGPTSEPQSVDLKALISRVESLEKRPANTAAQLGASTNVSVSSTPGSCWVRPESMRSGTFSLSEQTRLCDADGVYYATMNIRKNGELYFLTNKNTALSCDPGRVCKYLGSKVAQFILESVETDQNGVKIAHFTAYPL